MIIKNLPLRKIFGKLLFTISFLSLILNHSYGAQGKGSLPTNYGFIENKGQIVDQNYQPNPAVRYLYNNGNLNVQLKTTGFSYETVKIEKKDKKDHSVEGPLAEISNMLATDITRFVHRVDINFVGANPHPLIAASEKSKDYINYYTAGTLEEGATNVNHYRRVLYKDIYPKIDVEFVLNGKSGNGAFKYNFIVRPGGNVNDIKLQIEGADQTALTADGHINIETAYGEIDESIPYSFQINEQKRERPVNVSFKKSADNTYGIDVKQFDQSKTLVIDPSPWATYLTGGEGGIVTSLVTDNNGNIYSGGCIMSFAFNVATAGAHQVAYGGGDYDAILIKTDASGNKIWGTFYGGLRFDWGNDIALDGSGNILFTGYTSSDDQIATSGSHQETRASVWGTDAYDAFVVKFNAAGTRQWSTYLGGLDEDMGNGIAADNSGNIYVSGKTLSSSDIGTSSAYQISLSGGSDAFITKFNTSGVRQWGTYFGGTANDEAKDIVLDASGNILICGNSESGSLASPGAYQTANSGGDAILAKFNAAGSRLWSTYYGGFDLDKSNRITVDKDNNIYLAGNTVSSSGIATAGAHQTIIGGTTDAYIAKFNAAGGRQWGTYYGGPANESGMDVGVDSLGNVFIVGTNSFLYGNFNSWCSSGN
jgi:hypothetical protein